jgi:hypothetical protein
MLYKLLQRLWLPVVVLCLIYFGVWDWALRPIWQIPQGLAPVNWTDADLIRDRYPIRLIDPGWLANSHDWIFVESHARLGLIAIVTAAIFSINEFRLYKRPSA